MTTAPLASLPGIAEALGRGGLRVDRTTATVSRRGGRATVRDGRLQGPTLALALDGALDTGADTVDLRGTLAPSCYGPNRIPGRIPIVGPVVTGKRDEGVQAIDCTVAGPPGDTRVAVTPLSSIAPGVLRDLRRAAGR